MQRSVTGGRVGPIPVDTGWQAWFTLDSLPLQYVDPWTQLLALYLIAIGCIELEAFCCVVQTRSCAGNANINPLTHILEISSQHFILSPCIQEHSRDKTPSDFYFWCFQKLPLLCQDLLRIKPYRNMTSANITSFCLAGKGSALFARQLFHRGAFATVKLHNMEQTPLDSAVLVCDRKKSTDVNNVVEWRLNSIKMPE